MVGAAFVMATPAGATRYRQVGIEDVRIGGPWVIAIERGLTILDARTGAVLHRDPDSNRVLVTPLATGILIREAPRDSGGEPHSFLAPPDFRAIWRARCRQWHVAEGHLICAEPERAPSRGAAASNVHAVCRSLADGRVLWWRDIGGSGGEALDAGGRLMITTEEFDRKEYVRRVRRLAVLELASGRVLAETEVPGLVLRTRTALAPSHEFDGTRVTLRLQKAAVGACPDGVAVRGYTLDEPGHALLASDRCEPPPAPPTGPSPVPSDRTIISRPGAPEVSWFPVPGGNIVERWTPQGRWQAVLRWESREPWRPQAAFEGDGLVVVTGLAGTYASLDAFDAESGTPLWRYLGLTDMELISSSGWGPGRTSYLFERLEGARRKREELRARPPAGFSVAHGFTPSNFDGGQEAAGQPETPVIVDPAAPARVRMAGVLLAAWAPVVALALSSVALARARRRGPRTVKRALLAFGLVCGVLGGLAWLSGYELVATLALKVLVIAAFAQALRAAWVLDAARWKWPLRSALTIALLAIVPFALWLLLLA